MVWERGAKRREPWHFFGTPLCPSCPERGGYHGISGHPHKADHCWCVCCLCVCACVWVCLPHWVAWQQPLGTTSPSKKLKSCRGQCQPATWTAAFLCPFRRVRSDFFPLPAIYLSHVSTRGTHTQSPTKPVSLSARCKVSERSHNCYLDDDLSSLNTKETCCQRLANHQWSAACFSSVQWCEWTFH